MAAVNFLIIVSLLLTANVCPNHAVLERGIRSMLFSQEKSIHGFSKSLFKDAEIYIKGEYMKGELTKAQTLVLHWSLLRSECAQYFAGLSPEDLKAVIGRVDPTSELFVAEGWHLLKTYGPFSLTYKVPKTIIRNMSRLTDTDLSDPTTPDLSKSHPSTSSSHSHTTPKMVPSSTEPAVKITTTRPTNTTTRVRPSKKTKSGVTSTLESYLSQMTQASPESPVAMPTGPSAPTDINGDDMLKRHRRGAENPVKKKQLNVMPHPSEKKQKGLIVKAPNDGNYLLLVTVTHHENYDKPYTVEVEARMRSATGYLSAAEWPLLPFYGAMSLLYLAYGLVWLIVSACQWRELLRIQFWIGGVIALGMLEKAILFSEYNNVNNDGVPAHGLVVFAQVISCIKRTLSRILIIIVSMGFGIVKPRLGPALHRVLAVASLYFVLCVIEGSYRVSSVTADVSRKLLLAAVPLSVLDAIMCWWIFMSLMQTMRTLRIRKNIVKLTLYRHFTNILAVSVVASVAFMIWAIKYHHFNNCIKDWKELWIDDAFWHFLFAIVLLAIMVLWRPTANNQRYAFTPLMDVGDDDDDDDMTLSDAFHGMKMRGKSESDTTANSRTDKTRNKVEDDLKWVEENIPSAPAGIDTALPTLMDSDEEVMTTKLEMSKME